jgi:hypothetical protein
VDDAGAQHAAHAGEIPDMMQESVDERSAYDSGAGVYDEACRLVDDSEVRILMDDT